VGPFSLATTPAEPDFDVEILDEDLVRDQLSAAEELIYVGHREPALVAAGAALEGALRLSAGGLAGSGASAAALLEALLAAGTLTDMEYDLLFEALEGRDRLVRGYVPLNADAVHPARIGSVLAIALRLLEGLRHPWAERSPA
jgi:pimeloyl-ACP methyl ester carboxylesterase